MEKQPETLQEAIQFFGIEQNCIDTVAALRWPEGVACVACGCKEHYWLKTQRRWKCKDCYKQFSVKLDTIFEDSPLGLDKWLIALWMLVNCKNGVSSYELSRDLGISQKSAWFLLHRLRLALQQKSIEKIGGDGSPVEVDETYVGGKVQNMHYKKKLALVRLRNEVATKTMKGNAARFYKGNKVPVFGLLDRESRKVRATVIPNVKRETLQNEILNAVQKKSSIFSDEHTAYIGLKEQEYVHEIVNHMNQYVRGNIHTNGIENFWSLLKRGLKGTYVSVEPFHLGKYVDEQVFRFNTRKSDDGRKMKDLDRFHAALSQISGKRLTFAEVTGKVGETSF
jgi:transposase-like protein